MSKVLPQFTTLPEDNFGVRVENEMDARRLLWLVNQVGEAKLRKSAAKRSQYYPDSELFVSVLLKRFGLKVPSGVYAEARVSIYWVYVLVLFDYSTIKVGKTGRWPDRANDFVKTPNHYESFNEAVIALFDTEMSLAFRAPSESVATKIENEIKKAFAHRSAVSPYERRLINYGCGGHREWFDYAGYPEIIERLAPIGLRASLRASLTWEEQTQVLDTSEHPGH